MFSDDFDLKKEIQGKSDEDLKRLISGIYITKQLGTFKDADQKVHSEIYAAAIAEAKIRNISEQELYNEAIAITQEVQANQELKNLFNANMNLISASKSVSQMLEKATEKTRKKRIATACIILGLILLGIWIYLKYYKK